ncbi:MAG: hypothetical protein ACNA77_05325 [Opitutales bacterium]
MLCQPTVQIPQPRAAKHFAALTLLLALSFCLPLSLFSQDKLAEKSPFLPPGHGKKEPEPPKPVVQTQGPISRELEFRGIVQLGGVYQFSIFNKKDQKGYWLKENQRKDGISVNNFNPNASSILVMVNGRSERLSLMSASENPMPVAQAAPSGPSQPPGLAIPTQATNNNTEANTRRTVPRRRVILPKQN